MNDAVVFSQEVGAAILAGSPVVALESTLITHGFPYPANVETALAMEAAIRAEGAIPATIAVLHGRIKIGLAKEEIELLAGLGQSGVRKCSRRDLPIVVGLGQHGATTVAGTMIAAHMAGIRVFATGGIGGVHRGHPQDVSADLIELGRTPIAVVCAGAKSILDLPLTLEVLETQGVPVIGYLHGRTPGVLQPVERAAGRSAGEYAGSRRRDHRRAGSPQAGSGHIGGGPRTGRAGTAARRG